MAHSPHSFCTLFAPLVRWGVTVVLPVVVGLALVLSALVQLAEGQPPGSWPQPSAAGRVAQTCEIPHPAVCQIRVADKGGGHSVGTGTLVWKDATHGVVMTCEHVLRDTKYPVDIVVSFPNGKRFSSNAITADPAKELGAVVIRPPATITPVEIFPGDVTMGEPVRTFGQSRSSEGRVIPDANKSGWLVVSGQAYRGGSGGPILNAAGKLLGVFWGVDSYERPSRISGSSASRVRAFLCDKRRKILPWHAKGTPCPCPGAGCEAPAAIETPAEPIDELAAIRAEIAELRTLIAGWTPGGPGPAGTQGQPGPAGPAGPAGVDGKAPTINYDEIAAKVKSRIQGSLRMRVEPVR